jgi:hypothetical protein
VSYSRRPEFYPHRIDPVRRAFYRASARRAERIVTDSAFSRDEIVAAYGIDPSRIDVVPAGRFGGVHAAEVAREMFVLHVGDLHPRRNLSLLVDVVLELRNDLRWRALKLVLAGVDRGVLAALQEKTAAAGAAEALEYVGNPTTWRSPRCTGGPPYLRIHRAMKGSDCRCSRRWPAGHRSSRRRRRRCPKSPPQRRSPPIRNDARAWRDGIAAVLGSDERAQTLSEAGRLRAASSRGRALPPRPWRAYRRVGERR